MLKCLSFLLVAIFHSSIGSAHEIMTIELERKQAFGVINHIIPISFRPEVDKIFAAQTSIREDLKYIAVRPAEVVLKPIAGKSISLPNHTPTLLQDLRSHKSSHYQDLAVFQEYAMLHLLPNIIVTLRQTSSTFTIEQKYAIPDITASNATKLYKINQQSARKQCLMVIENSSHLYRLTLHKYTKYQLPSPVTISHLQFLSPYTFITAQFQNGLSIYWINDTTLKPVAAFPCKQLQLQQQCSITDFIYNQTSQILTVLDTTSGVYQFLIQKQYEMNQQAKPIKYRVANKEKIINITDCQAIDSISPELFVLICSSALPSSIIEVYKYVDRFTNQSAYRKKDPVIHSCSFNDLIVTKQFYIAFDSYSADIFWNSKANGLMQTEHTKQHLNLPGLSVFSLSNSNYFYAVESNMLTKYELSVFPGLVYAYSPIPVSKDITVIVPGKCPINQTQPINFKESKQCMYSSRVRIRISEEDRNSPQRRSVSLGIILLMLIVLLILVWICLKKYRSLERYARNVLENVRKNNSYNQKKFTL